MHVGHPPVCYCLCATASSGVAKQDVVRFRVFQFPLLLELTSSQSDNDVPHPLIKRSLRTLEIAVGLRA